jgi:hypothetical protein
VYIDSPGGAVSLGENLLALLSAPDLDDAPPCNVITVVTSFAGSAAADMLSAGDYAIAYPASTIVYHGTRLTFDDAVTTETASSVMESLRVSNERHAMRLAIRSVWRFIFRYTYLYDQIKQRRSATATPRSDLDCFIGLLEERVSESARQVLRLSRRRYERYEDLVSFYKRGIPKKNTMSRIAEAEALALKRMILYELKRNPRPDWRLGDGGLIQITNDFLLLSEYISTYESPPFRHQCERWREFFLSPTEKRRIARLPAKQRSGAIIAAMRPIIQPVWLYFVALCHVLQERDNVLSAADAYWLGLIDEVIGLDELNFRLIMESAPRGSRTKRRKSN